MKLITQFFILFLILSITSENLLNQYSIEPFKDALKIEGIFKIIELIKRNYGQDVAIISWEEFTENRAGNCKRLVTEYIPSSDQISVNITESLDSTTSIKEKSKSNKLNWLYNIRLIMWRKKLKDTKKKSDMIFHKIIKRVRELQFSSNERSINYKNIENLKRMLDK